VVGIAILVLCGLLVGAAVFAILWAAVAGLLSLSRDVLDQLSRGKSRLPRHRPIADLPSAANGEKDLPTALPDLSTEAMWHQMQGTSRRSRGRRRPGPGARPAARS
jgi:hypothetical protein